MFATPKPRPAQLLAFDTSTQAMAVALAVGDHAWTWDGEGAAAASAELLPRIQTLLHQAGITLSELDAIAFGCGPGAFTGLRTACSVAQGLAFGANKPVLAIDSLRIGAEDARALAPSFDVDVVMDARMGEVYAARYAYTDGQWQVLREPGLCTPAQLNTLWASAAPLRVAGSAWPSLAAVLNSGSAPLAPTTGRAAALLRCAQAAWLAGEGLDAAQALPVYLRDKVAQTTAERALAKAVQA